MKKINKNQTTKKPLLRRPPAAIKKFEKMFKDMQIQPDSGDNYDFLSNEQSTWIVSDNNSTFKSFINYNYG